MSRTCLPYADANNNLYGSGGIIFASEFLYISKPNL